MVNDTLSDVLTRIRNGCLNNSQVISVPLTRLSQQVCHTLEKEGFIESSQRDPTLADKLIITLKYKESQLRSEISLQDRAKNKSVTEKQEIVTSDKQIDGSIKDSLEGRKPADFGQALSKKRPCITNLKRISKPGLRVYVRHKQIPTVLGGLGILILSTPKGIMTDREARFRKVGGEILCSVW